MLILVTFYLFIGSSIKKEKNLSFRLCIVTRVKDVGVMGCFWEVSWDH